MATIIAPSLLACDFLNIETEVKCFEGIDHFWFHLDIMDSHFVPNLTFGHSVVSRLKNITLQKLDAHLMVTNPQFFIETFAAFGIHNFTFHLEAADNPLALIQLAKKYYPSVGLSIKPNTPVDSLTPELLQAIDLVLIMSVEPGFGGQSFIESSYQKIKTLSQLKEQYQFQIQVDGGVGARNAKELINCGADNLVAGSFVFKDGPEMYRKNIEILRS